MRWLSVHVLQLPIHVPNVLSQRLRAHCFDLITGPSYSIFDSRIEATLALISVICRKGLLMISFGSEMAKGRICSLWG